MLIITVTKSYRTLPKATKGYRKQVA